jgi:hypothetical protein
MPLFWDLAQDLLCTFKWFQLLLSGPGSRSQSYVLVVSGPGSRSRSWVLVVGDGWFQDLIQDLDRTFK